jgi:thioredoxin reductase
MSKRKIEVLIVGAGPSGLACALELKRLGFSDMLVVDREAEPGGMPQFCHHQGYGWRDLRRLYTGPQYSRHYARKAEEAGIELKTRTMVTGWSDNNTLQLTNRRGREEIQAQAILLATGCRERPRSARLIAGSRPSGIFTTGSLQRFVYDYHLPAGKKAVVVGAELVGFSALLTLFSSHTPVARMITHLPHHQAYGIYKAFKIFAADVLTGTTITPQARVCRIFGRKRVEGVEIEHLATGQKETIDCDTVIFSGDWIPENELSVSGHLSMNERAQAPLVDGCFRTSIPGIFATGNLLHGAEPADYVALEGRSAARPILDYLHKGAWPQGVLPINAHSPIQWVSPAAVTPGSAGLPLGRLLFRSEQFLAKADLHIHQGGKTLLRQSFRSLGPHYSIAVSDRWLTAIDPAGGEILADLESAS